MLNLINVNEVQTTSKKVKTPDTVLLKTQNRIRNYVAWTYGVGKKLTNHKPAQIVVKRDMGGMEQTLLAIKIANETFSFISFNYSADEEAEEALKIADSLVEYKMEIFHFSQWVDANVGKPKDQRIPRPESFDSPITALAEVS